MPASLTLKNFPAVLCDRWNASAEIHRRSLNVETIVCPEEVLLPSRISVVERLEPCTGTGRIARAGDVPARRHRRAQSGRTPMIVVDSNVLACLYVPGRCTRSAPPMREKGPPWAALLLWRREFRNNLAGCLRRNALSFAQAHALQPEAEGLMADTEHTEDSLGVQRLADDCHCPAYDCKSIALAHPFGARR